MEGKMSIVNNPYADRNGFHISRDVWAECSKAWAKMLIAKGFENKRNAPFRIYLAQNDYDAIKKLAEDK
jgi:hypothetical protein